MLISRSRGLTIALVVGALTLIGASGASAQVPDEPQKGFAPLCITGAGPQGTPPQECEDGPIS
ncbi:MAG: hypothetical protein ACRDYF_12050, partial [Acidimicrobiia bacterium]